MNAESQHVEELDARPHPERWLSVAAVALLVTAACSNALPDRAGAALGYPALARRCARPIYVIEVPDRCATYRVRLPDGQLVEVVVTECGAPRAPGQPGGSCLPDGGCLEGYVCDPATHRCDFALE